MSGTGQTAARVSWSQTGAATGPPTGRARSSGPLPRRKERSMFAVRKLALAGAAAAVGLALTGLVPASAEAASGCYGIGGGKYNCNVWKTAPSYFAGNVRAGTLNAGTNYFYCQAVGSEVVDGPYRNHWWAKTDDDS